MKRSHTRDFPKDLRIGVKVGLWLALACAIIATTTFVLGGRASFVARAKVGLPVVLASYLIGGLAGGLIIGFLRPLRSTASGSFFIGAVSSIPAILCLLYVALPREIWFPVGAISGVITALLMGGLGAALHGETRGWTD
jgi:hypothetical protein